MLGHVARMGELRNAYKDLVGKPEVTRTLWGFKHIRQDNIKVDLNNRVEGCTLD